MFGKINTREQRHKQIKEKILQNALGLIEKKGLRNFSLRELARITQYSPAGLYEYYPGKEAILDALIDRGNTILFEYMSAVPKTEDSKSYLLALGQAYIQFAIENKGFFKLLMTERRMIKEKERESGKSFLLLQDSVATYLKSRKKKPAKNLSIMEISYILWSLVHGTATLQVEYLSGSQLPFKKLDRHGLEVLLEGI